MLPLLPLLLLAPLLSAQTTGGWNVTYFIISDPAAVATTLSHLTALPENITATSTTYAWNPTLRILSHLLYLPAPSVYLPPAPSQPERTHTIIFTKSTQSSPEFCTTTRWEHTTTVSIPVPAEVTRWLKPTEWVRASTRTAPGPSRDRWPFVEIDTAIATPETVTAYLDPSAVPQLPTTTTAAAVEDPCLSPLAAATGNRTVDAEPGPGPGKKTKTKTKTKVETYIEVIVIFPLFFVLGFGESFYWFRRMMRGESALRGATVSWFCITILAVFFIRVSRRRRRALERRECVVRWNAMSAGARLRNWARWGFTWSYPEELLGDAAGRVGEEPPMEEGRGHGADVEMRRVGARRDEDEDEEQLPAYTPREEGKPDYSPPGVLPPPLPGSEQSRAADTPATSDARS